MKRLLIISILLFACRAPQQHGVTIARTGAAGARVVVTTVGVAIKETGPAATVKEFGEVYAFSPNFFAVHKDEPTMIHFLNVQPDDNHDFMLFTTDQVFLKMLLPPLKETGHGPRRKSEPSAQAIS